MIAAGIILGLALLGFLLFGPRHLTLAEEERLLRDHYRARDGELDAPGK